jgi:hypothetical protein
MHRLPYDMGMTRTRLSDLAECKNETFHEIINKCVNAIERRKQYLKGKEKQALEMMTQGDVAEDAYNRFNFNILTPFYQIINTFVIEDFETKRK